MLWFYLFFLVSGFCSILYELIWLRLAMAQFTVTTPFVSIVLSVFMLGLGAGSWAAGRWAARTNASGLHLYALVELLIGASALLVPFQLAWGRALVEMLGGQAPLSSGMYHLVSGLWITLSLAPWCACMGATFPFAMLAIRQRLPGESPRSFSYLYLANVSGAVLGSVLPLLLIETSGFRGALRVGLAGNLSLALSAWLLSRGGGSEAAPEPALASPIEPARDSRKLLWLLFATGLTTMGAEVIWVRLYTPSLGTVVYAFAAILGSYLLATYAGSTLYRLGKSKAGGVSGTWLAVLGLAALLPLIACDSQWHWSKALRVAVGILPFSLAAGYLTPRLMDGYSGGEPGRAGRGYAVNILGCIVGPLLAGFILLPLAGERMALAAFALPWLALALFWHRRTAGAGARWGTWAALPAAAAVLLLARSNEEQFHPRKVLRDHTATVVATGTTRLDKRLLINGIITTNLTPITKMMAHLPLAHLPRIPRTALVICFGMGTTHRSVLSWGVHSTAVDLTPSVPRMFAWFHADAERLAGSPLSRIVIDDGRAFLERTRDRFDVIVVDPPPPVEAAASSLLYSKEFYAAAKPRLEAGGILQQWLPEGDAAIFASVAKALKESFPYVRVFGSLEGWGHHFLASESAIAPLTAAALAARMPGRAAADLVEWGPATDPERQFAAVVSREISLDDLIRQASSAPALQDDRPVNEYYLLRRSLLR
ncbi:MAG: fused MFS/spermidine synthase [Bryobacteraceae bacterium]